MRIASLSFDPAPRTPNLPGLGIALSVLPEPARRGAWRFEITCRMAHARLPAGKLALPAAIFLTAVHLTCQRPTTINLVEERLLFEDDALDNGSYVVVAARGELDVSHGPVGPLLLHASCFEFVSSVIHVA